VSGFRDTVVIWIGGGLQSPEKRLRCPRRHEGAVQVNGFQTVVRNGAPVTPNIQPVRAKSKNAIKVLFRHRPSPIVLSLRVLPTGPIERFWVPAVSEPTPIFASKHVTV